MLSVSTYKLGKLKYCGETGSFVVLYFYFYYGLFQPLGIIKISNEKGEVMELELKDYFKILLKWLWLILILPIISSTLSAYISFFVLEPVYEANTTLYVINKSNGSDFSIAYNDLLIGQQLVKDYKEIVKSRRVTSRVIEKLEITHITPSQLADKINVNSKHDTRLIEIKVQNNNPEMAANIANEVAEVFTEEVMEIMKVENINIVDTVPTAIIQLNHVF